MRLRKLKINTLNLVSLVYNREDFYNFFITNKDSFYKQEFSYDNGSALIQYDVNVKKFDTNINFEWAYFGVIKNGSLPNHIDECRLGSLILPIEDAPMILISNGFSHTVKTQPFILDTRISHSVVECKENYIFFSIDILKNNLELYDIQSDNNLYINVKKSK
jgi:hypothetical protein